MSGAIAPGETGCAERPLRVLLTGGASFTGAWFAAALRARGHRVVAMGRRPVSKLEPSEQTRLAALSQHGAYWGGAPFGSPAFARLCRERGPFDVFCAHGARAAGCNDPSFDPLDALRANIEHGEDALSRSHARALVVTGSVFEAGEGQGEAPLRAFNNYGLSKTWTWHYWRYVAERAGVGLGKFVIANPFGPFAKPNLAGGLIEAWLDGETARLRAPHLVRDHVPIRPLAVAYARFVENIASAQGPTKLAPSAWPESVAVFAARLARAMRPRLGAPCRVIGLADAASDQPLRRVGTTPLADWAERELEREWDELAGHHLGERRHVESA